MLVFLYLKCRRSRASWSQQQHPAHLKNMQKATETSGHATNGAVAAASSPKQCTQENVSKNVSKNDMETNENEDEDENKSENKTTKTENEKR